MAFLAGTHALKRKEETKNNIPHDNGNVFNGSKRFFIN
jgi:hypothetical protein